MLWYLLPMVVLSPVTRVLQQPKPMHHKRHRSEGEFFLRSCVEKGTPTRSLDGEQLPFSLARARLTVAEPAPSCMAPLAAQDLAQSLFRQIAQQEFSLATLPVK